MEAFKEQGHQIQLFSAENSKLIMLIQLQSRLGPNKFSRRLKFRSPSFNKSPKEKSLGIHMFRKVGLR